MTEAFEKRAQIKESIAELHSKASKIYKEFASEVEKHSNSNYSIPEVTKTISSDSITSVKAFKVLTVAQYNGQQITNQYYVLYAPKLNEIYYDAKILTQVLYNAFMNEDEIQAIKTSAEKERQYSSFAIEINHIWQKIQMIMDNFGYLGRYTENIVYSLSRLQNMLDSIDKMRAKEMWSEENQTNTALEILNSDDLSIEEFMESNTEDTSKAKADKTSEPKPEKKLSKKQPAPEVYDDFDEDDF